ncbi:HAD family hydrolase [Streptomyces sp. NPDC051180]|uniref:HAD family hydrolase n=1 Tax=Streptomyces sp. NPDC051180 TaxID=3155797 RepID=UPI00344DA029
MSIAVTRAAFFDVDETLITCKSMACVLARFWGRGEAAARRLAAARSSLQAQLRDGVPREQVNRSFFRFLAGSRLDELEACGREWYEKARAGGLVHTPVYDALRRHAHAGDLIVLVSGAFSACLDPLAREVGADLVVCTVPEVTSEGVLTGRLNGPPMIGEAKAQAARGIMTAFDLDPADCFAYADDDSDLPLLRAVGHPVLVGDGPVSAPLVETAAWSWLPGPAPAPSARPVRSTAVRSAARPRSTQSTQSASSASSTPNASRTPSGSTASSTSGVASAPGRPCSPGVPGVPGTELAPDSPSGPGAPGAPGVPRALASQAA